MVPPKKTGSSHLNILELSGKSDYSNNENKNCLEKRVGQRRKLISNQVTQKCFNALGHLPSKGTLHIYPIPSNSVSYLPLHVQVTLLMIDVFHFKGGQALYNSDGEP